MHTLWWNEKYIKITLLASSDCPYPTKGQGKLFMLDSVLMPHSNCSGSCSWTVSLYVLYISKQCCRGELGRSFNSIQVLSALYATSRHQGQDHAHLITLGPLVSKSLDMYWDSYLCVGYTTALWQRNCVTSDSKIIWNRGSVPHLRGRIEEDHGMSARIVGVPPEIRTENLPSTSWSVISGSKFTVSPTDIIVVAVEVLISNHIIRQQGFESQHGLVLFPSPPVCPRLLWCLPSFLSSRYWGSFVKLTTPFHLVLRSRVLGAKAYAPSCSSSRHSNFAAVLTSRSTYSS
jgi:hypothetical protein